MLVGSFVSVLLRFGWRHIHFLSPDLVRILLLPSVCLCRLELGCGKAPFLAVSDAEIFFLGLVLPVAPFIKRTHSQHNVGVWIMTGRVRIVNGNISAHSLGNKTVLNEIGQKFLPLCRCQFNRKSRNKLTGKAAVLGLFVFLHGVPKNTPVFPFGWSELRQKYLLPYEPFLACKVVPYSIIVV